MKILQQLQTDILDQSTSLSTTLRKAKVLAHQLQSEELSNWVSQELDGYKSRKDLPDYRILRTGCFGKWTNGYWTVSNHLVPLYQIKDEKLKEFLTTYYVPDGIRSLETLAFGEKQHLLVGSEFVGLVNHYVGEGGYGFAEIEYAVGPRDLEQILDTVKNRLLDFVLKLGETWNVEDKLPPDDMLRNMVSVVIYNALQGGNMSVFDQRGQKVNYQYNAAGNINLNAVQNKDELIAELEKLQGEIEHAKDAHALANETAVEAEYNLLQAAREAKKEKPSKELFLTYIGKAKALFDDIAAAAGLVAALVKAAEIANHIFH